MLRGMSVAEARPAATVVVIREGGGGGVEVLLVRRNDKLAFMAGAFVFPGGRVDVADQRLAIDTDLRPEVLLKVAAGIKDVSKSRYWRLPVTQISPARSRSRSSASAHSS